jgi:hypothetical protein
VDFVPANSADNPLPNIPGEVEQQIPDAIGRFVGAMPEVILRQSVDAVPDLRQVLV